MAGRKRRRKLGFWRGERSRSFGPGSLDSALPEYSPLSIAPPLSRARRRSPWMMIGALLALGTAVGIAFSR